MAAAKRGYQLSRHGLASTHRNEALHFPRGVKIIPVLDSLGRIDYLLTDQHPSLVLGSFAITSHSPSFIIAEIGNNHQGDIEIAKALVDAAIDAQVDCVKFQMRDSTALYGSKILKDDSADLGAQYTMDLLNNSNCRMRNFSKSLIIAKGGVTSVYCMGYAVARKGKYGMAAYKVASADLTNFELLEAIARTSKPMICSTGMSTEQEIKNASFLRSWAQIMRSYTVIRRIPHRIAT